MTRDFLTKDESNKIKEYNSHDAFFDADWFVDTDFDTDEWFDKDIDAIDDFLDNLLDEEIIYKW